jgi:poly-gamma-glutamate system protein
VSGSPIAVLFSRRKGYRSVAFLVTAALAVASYAIVVRIPDGSVPHWVLAARRAAVAGAVRGQETIRQERIRRGLPISPADRLRTGLVGVDSSPVTTELGSAAAKRTSTEPVFAAAIVEMLYQAGVRPGSVVAVGMTGSFPGLDLDTEVAIEAMDAVPLPISSVGASQWGANEVDLTWLDMEETLLNAGVIRHRSIAVAPGGTELATESPAPEEELRRRLAEASGLQVVPNLPLAEEVRFRMELYDAAAAAHGGQLVAFVNVGGSAAGIGANGAGEEVIPSGLSRPHWSKFEASRLGVVGQMALQQLPIVNLLEVARLAELYELPWDPNQAPPARDLPPPPPEPIAVAVGLALLLATIAAAHRLGFFRVPEWEMPGALRSRWRMPGSRAH